MLYESNEDGIFITGKAVNKPFYEKWKDLFTKYTVETLFIPRKETETLVKFIDLYTIDDTKYTETGTFDENPYR